MGEQKLNICGEKLHPPVDPSDDYQMVAVGIRKPKFFLNKKVFEQTDWEKKELKRVKRKGISKVTLLRKPKENFIKGKLVIYMEKSKVENFKSTHSFNCFEEEVDEIIGNLRNKGYKVKKTYFQNKLWK
jgi:hypothetical protein